MHKSTVVAILAALAGLISACDDSPTDNPLTFARPEAISPADGSSGQPLAVQLYWNSDIEQTPFQTILYFGTSRSVSPMVTLNNSQSYSMTGLEPGETYFWRVEVRGENGARGISPLWSFRTGEGPASTFRYPLEIGRYWQYEGHDWTDNMNPPSLDPENSIDDISFSSVSVIDAEAVGHKTVYQLQDYTSYGDLPVAYPASGWYMNAEDGLWEVAYENAFGKGLPKPFVGKFSIPDPESCNAGQHNYTPGGLPAIHFSFLNALIEHDSALVIRYPLTVDQRWTYRTIPGVLQIKKACVGWQHVTVPAGTFDCFVVDWTYTLASEPTGSSLTAREYVANIGLVKREFHSLDFTISDPTSGEPLGTADWHSVIQLTDYGYLRDLPPTIVEAARN